MIPLPLKFKISRRKILISSAVKANRGIGATVVAAVGHFSPTFHPKKDRGHDSETAAAAAAWLLNVVGREVHFPPAEVRVPWEASAR